MRETPELWKSKAERVQWGCALLDLMGEKSLKFLPLLLSGYRSVEQSATALAHQKAVQTARIILPDLMTEASVRTAVNDLLDGMAFPEEAQQPRMSYHVDPVDLSFARLDSIDPDIASAQKTLRQGLPHKGHGLELADTREDLAVAIRVGQPAGERMRIRFGGLTFGSPDQQQYGQTPVDDLKIGMQELRDLACALDKDDQKHGRRSLAWETRINRILLEMTTQSGLQETDQLDLSVLKHLIGLPGSGKSTLISLICIHNAIQGKRTAVFFPSIEMSREYLDNINRYENLYPVKAALLMGRSGDTHRRHTRRFAELVAESGQGGFAQTRPAAELFATSCPLPAFADYWPNDGREEQVWYPGDAPCERLYGGPRGNQQRLCPAWSLCGRVTNQKRLTQANVWLGNIMSADTRLPAHTTALNIQYFEYIAQYFDLVIFDECDSTQQTLDERGATTLKFSGSDGAYQGMEQFIARVNSGAVRPTPALQNYTLQFNEFQRHLWRFMRQVGHFYRHKLTQALAERHSDKLLTVSYLVGEALGALKLRSRFTPLQLSALTDFWESAMYLAYFERTKISRKGWRNLARYAPELGLSPEQARTHWETLNAQLREYLSLQHDSEAVEQVETVTELLAGILGTDDRATLLPYVQLLMATGFTIASYQAMARAARPLARRGELPPELFYGEASLEMKEQIPRSILGTFSAVRYRRTEGRRTQVEYIIMGSTPRLLLQRLPELGCNVLLTSATSFMEKSTQFHISRMPDYVISSTEETPGQVNLYFKTAPHPATGEPLRFSGANYDRTENLRKMTTYLSSPTVTGGLSPLELTLAAGSLKTTLGKRRMVALVVNSYEQVELVVDEIYAQNPELGKRTRGLARQLPAGKYRERYVLRGQVEELGENRDVDLLVFPMASLGRGVNIVFRSDDDDQGKAAIGVLYFLTRPHPAAGDLSLLISTLARHTEQLDGLNFSGKSLAEVQEAFNIRRSQTYSRAATMLSRPMSASQLDAVSLDGFAANLLVPLLQTIGRGTRKNSPVDVYFVDAAWAPRSAEHTPEEEKSSLLVVMQNILEECLNHPNLLKRELYTRLYGPFREGFRDIDGLIPPARQGSHGRAADDLLVGSAYGLEGAMDGYNPLEDTRDDFESFDEEDDL